MRGHGDRARRSPILAVGAALIALAASRLAAQEEPAIGPPAPLHEQILSVPGDPERPATLQVTLMTPPGRGPFPLAVVNHGADGRIKRDQAPRYHTTFAAWYFLSRGYAVVLPMMRGFAGSGGITEFHGCDLARVGLENARDIKAVIDFVGRRPEIDASRVVMSGQSFGGWNTLAYGAIGDTRVKGLINFAGGVRASDCQEQEQDLHMAAALAELAGRTKAPSIWFYGDNDRLFPPATWRADYAAYRTLGGDVELVAYGDFGDNAHNFLGSSEALKIWTPKVDAFLTRIGLPSRERFPEYLPPKPPPPTGYAQVGDVDAVPYLNDAARGLYRAFLEKPFPRAFIISPRLARSEIGGFDPVARGLAVCAEISQGCAVYAYDGDVVWRGPRPVRPPADDQGAILARTAQAGITTMIDQSILINPDCTPRQLPELVVTQPPEQGAARVVATQGYPKFAPASPFAACDTVREPAVELDYTPAAGFSGVDYLGFTITDAGAPARNIKMAITVK